MPGFSETVIIDILQGGETHHYGRGKSSLYGGKVDSLKLYEVKWTRLLLR